MPRVKSIYPAMACFFVMGFVDIVGPAINYVRDEYSLSATALGSIQILVFIWYALFAMPSGFIMGRFGRRNTVILSVLLTSLACILPFAWRGLLPTILGFVLLGVSNTIMQVSLNPFVSSFVSRGSMSSIITLGQLVKSVSSVAGPVLASLALLLTGNWQYVLLGYAVFSMFSAMWLACAVPRDVPSYANRSSLATWMYVLKDKYIVGAFVAILMIVGIDVSMNTYIPVMLTDKFSQPVGKAALGSSLYFFARLAGTVVCVLLLRRYRDKKILVPSVLVTLAAILLLAFSPVHWAALSGIALAAMASACVFPVIYSSAIKYSKAYTNEISSLMIAGLCGGSILPPVVGAISDMLNITLGMSAVVVPALYILYFSIKLK